MRQLYDGMPTDMMTDQMLLEDYDAIREKRVHEIYADKGMYLFMRQRELYYELQKRGVEVAEPHNLVGFPKEQFKYWSPPLSARASSINRVVSECGDNPRYHRQVMGRGAYLKMLAQNRSLTTYLFMANDQKSSETYHLLNQYSG